MVSRRDFLRVGSLSVVGLSVAEQAAIARNIDATTRRSCIFILMTGGPSQLETFDPKPEAPAEIRGPLRTISTALPGVAFSEGLPQLARRADRLSVLRSLSHDASPIHETGLQLLQTGRLASAGVRFPSFGAVVSRALGPRHEVPANIVAPSLLGNTGVGIYQGQGGGFWGDRFDPVTADATDPRRSDPLSLGLAVEDETESTRRAYGHTRFGQLLLRSRQLVEQGARCVTVNLFDTLAGQITWDCHADASGAPATLYHYRDTLCPQFDRALSGLLDDLNKRGLLDDTLVVALGEFGRTPRLNAAGGRDHWPAVWSGLVAGGGTRGGQVVGSSDATASEPTDRPIHPGEVTATIYRSLGLDPQTTIVADDGAEFPLGEHGPIDELF